MDEARKKLFKSLGVRKWWLVTAGKNSRRELSCIRDELRKKGGLYSIQDIMRLITTARRLGVPQEKLLHKGEFLYVFALTVKGRVCGYIVLCCRNSISPLLTSIFTLFFQVLTREVYKEIEYSNLEDTIRPRTIALSTIHTIHRLMETTLTVEELLLKIARLSLQILRAKRCSIILIEKGSKAPTVQALIGTQKKRVRKKVPRSELEVVRKVVKENCPIFRKTYISAPLIDEETLGAITISNKRGKPCFTDFDREILTTLAEQAVIAIKNIQLYEEQQDLIISSIKSLATTLDTRAPHPYPHTAAFTKMVLALGNRLGLTRKEKRNLHYASLLHDAGTPGVSGETLKKSRSLTRSEYKEIKRHPVENASIIKNLPLELLKPVIPTILHHHERYDGKGYPDGLKGEDIPLGSRILGVVDAFEAMICKRPYRKAMTIPEALSEIRKNKKTQFDPEVAGAFLDLSTTDKFQEILSGMRKDGH